MLLQILSLALSLVALAVAAGCLILWNRARAARSELARRLHDSVLALDVRCDALQRQFDAGDLERRIDHLLLLIAASERQGRLDANICRRLQGFVLDLHEEAGRAVTAG